MSNYIDNIVKNAVTYDLVSKPLADDMANEFSIQSTYAVGDYVMHDYKLYKCISAVTNAGNWNSAKWQECKIGDEINGGVKFTAQTLTSEQKAQARNNIGAVSQEETTPDAVRYSAQSLTDAQKNQARVNVGTVASTSIAEEFSTSKAYAVGDLVMYDSKLYKFKTAHSAGAWNVAQVDAVSVNDEISSLSNELKDSVDYDRALSSIGFENMILDWEQGAYSKTTGNKVISEQQYWVRTVDVIDNTKIYRIVKLGDNVVIRIIMKDSNDVVTYKELTTDNIGDGIIFCDGVSEYKICAGFTPTATVVIQDVHDFIKDNLWIAYDWPIKNSKVFYVKTFGAVGDGVNDDTQAINDAILIAFRCGGGTVFFESGTYLTSAPITIMRGVSIVGAGKNNTIIKLNVGSNCNVMQTYRYNQNDVYTGQSDYPMNFSIEDLQIDGSATFTYDQENDLYTVSGNTSGCGIRIRGCRYVVKNIYVHNIAKAGITFNFNSTYQYDTINDASVFNNSYIDDIAVFSTGNESIIYNSAWDINIGSLWLTRACLTKSLSGFATHDRYPDVLCALNIGCSVNINFAHIWNNKYAYGVKITTGPTVIFDTTVIESSKGGAYINNANMNIVWSNNYMHDIAQNPYVYLLNALNTTIANFVVSRDNVSGNTSSTLLIDTDNVLIENFVCTYKKTTDVGNPIDIVASHKNVKINGAIQPIDDNNIKAQTENVNISINGEHIELNINTNDIGECIGTVTNSVINVTGCAINESLVNESSNIINYDKKLLTNLKGDLIPTQAEINLQNAIAKSFGIGYPAKSPNSNVYFADEDGKIGVILRDGFDSANSGGIETFYHPDYPNGAIVDEEGNLLGVLSAPDESVNPLRGKKFSILGDSISTYQGYIPDGYAYWYPRGDVDSVDKTWWKKLIDLSGMILVKNASWSGSTVTGDTGSSSAGAGCSNARIDDLKNGNVLPEIIICYISTNDWAYNNELGSYDSKENVDTTSSTISNIADAYALMLYKIRNNYPNAIVYCVTSLEGRQVSGDTSYPIINTQGNTLHEVNHTITEIAHIFGAKVIDLQTCGIHYWNVSNYTVDGTVHPNDAGTTLIARTIYRQLNNDFKGGN